MKAPNSIYEAIEAGLTAIGKVLTGVEIATLASYLIQYEASKEVKSKSTTMKTELRKVSA